jgi:hypothetical protein
MHMLLKINSVLLGVIMSTTVFAAPLTTPENFIASGCDAAGECHGQLKISGSSAESLCSSTSMTLAWRKNRMPMLMTCNITKDDDGGRSFVVSGKTVTELTYGRFVSISALIDNPDMNIPDRFSQKPLCSPASIRKLKKATFTLLNKTPSNNGYCYEVTYIHAGDRRVYIERNNGLVDPRDSNYFAQNKNYDTIIVHKLFDAARALRSDN